MLRNMKFSTWQICSPQMYLWDLWQISVMHVCLKRGGSKAVYTLCKKSSFLRNEGPTRQNEWIPEEEKNSKGGEGGSNQSCTYRNVPSNVFLDV